MSKSSMSVSSNSIADILILRSKLSNREFNPTGIGNEGDGLVAVVYTSCCILQAVLLKQKQRKSLRYGRGVFLMQILNCKGKCFSIFR